MAQLTPVVRRELASEFHAIADRLKLTEQLHNWPRRSRMDDPWLGPEHLLQLKFRWVGHNSEVLEIMSRTEWHLERLMQRLERRWNWALEETHGGDYGNLTYREIHEERMALLRATEEVAGRLRQLRRDRHHRQDKAMSPDFLRRRSQRALASFEKMIRQGEEKEAREAAEWGWSVEAYRDFMTVDDLSLTRIRDAFYGAEWPAVSVQILVRHGRLGDGANNRYPMFLEPGDLQAAFEQRALARKVRSRG